MAVDTEHKLIFATCIRDGEHATYTPEEATKPGWYEEMVQRLTEQGWKQTPKGWLCPREH